jgi:hypothetical protein
LPLVFAQVTITFSVVILCALLGGGIYEHFVIDPSWPKRPDLIQPNKGGVSRARFWLPAHISFEIVLLSALLLSWKTANVRWWLVVAIAVYVATRLWSAMDFIPKAMAFEKALVIDEKAAKTWTLRSKFRLPLELTTLVLLLNAARLAFAR